jgi:hypothetical protein
VRRWLGSERLPDTSVLAPKADQPAEHNKPYYTALKIWIRLSRSWVSVKSVGVRRFTVSIVDQRTAKVRCSQTATTVLYDCF